MIEKLAAVKDDPEPQTLAQAIFFEHGHRFAKEGIRAGERSRQPAGHHQQIAFPLTLQPAHRPEIARRNRPVHGFHRNPVGVVPGADGDRAHFQSGSA